MTVEEYRQAILQAMTGLKDNEGNPLTDEKGAHEILDTFSDPELMDSMPFNPPEETAAFLLDADADDEA